ncbi:hypothetical protein F4805DRAFT_94166 [Annulohypoxylon moriforme]|nr:hypothetical protein F4805DRAFT_94166 [Annulohypoxylon moriforme]
MNRLYLPSGVSAFTGPAGAAMVSVVVDGFRLMMRRIRTGTEVGFNSLLCFWISYQHMLNRVGTTTLGIMGFLTLGLTVWNLGLHADFNGMPITPSRSTPDSICAVVHSPASFVEVQPRRSI